MVPGVEWMLSEGQLNGTILYPLPEPPTAGAGEIAHGGPGQPRTCTQGRVREQHTALPAAAQVGPGASRARTGEPSRCPVTFLTLCPLRSVPLA